jgi:hypothetical protein
MNQYQNVHLNAASSIQKNDVKQQLQEPQQQTQEEIKTPVVTVSKHIVVENGKNYVEKSNDYSNKNNTININNNNNNKKYKFFIVSADIQNDIYNLVDPDNSSDCTIANKLIASIPDYKTSVFMNALFRNIKENKSLDALEESDDEEEFENTNIDKFVDLTKKIKMKCIFNYKFKKWTPVECVN